MVKLDDRELLILERDHWKARAEKAESALSELMQAREVAIGFGSPAIGKEAEELRKGVEALLADADKKVYCRDLERLLDDVDARDSLAYLEEKAELVKRAEEAEAERDTWRAECESISKELGLPPTIRPAEGELRRMVEDCQRLKRERDAALLEAKAAIELARPMVTAARLDAVKAQCEMALSRAAGVSDAEFIERLARGYDRSAIRSRACGMFDDADSFAAEAEYIRSRGVHLEPARLLGVAAQGDHEQTVRGYYGPLATQIERLLAQHESVWESLERWQRGEQIESDYLDRADWEALARAKAREL